MKSDARLQASEDIRHLQLAAARYRSKYDIVNAQRSQLASSETELSNERSEFLACAQRVLGTAWPEIFEDIRNKSEVDLQAAAGRVVLMMKSLGTLPRAEGE